MNRARLGLLTGTHAINDLYQGLVPALLPFMVLERGYSYTEASGLMLAATGLSSMVQPLFGLYADRSPRPWMVPAGFVVAALGLALVGMSPDYWVSWLAAVLCGLGIAAYHPSATVAARMAGGSSQKAMSVFSVGGTAGASFAPHAGCGRGGRRRLAPQLDAGPACSGHAGALVCLYLAGWSQGPLRHPAPGRGAGRIARQPLARLLPAVRGHRLLVDSLCDGAVHPAHVRDARAGRLGLHGERPR